MNYEIASPFWLGSCLVDPLEGMVTCGTGEASHLQNKPMEVLLVLSAAAGRVVPSDQIIEQVWGPTSGGDEGLKRCVHSIRKALGDSSTNPAIIRTVRGRGYACVPVPKYLQGAECVSRECVPPETGDSVEQTLKHRELERNRPLTVVSILLTSTEVGDTNHLHTIPATLMKDYLETLDAFESAFPLELGVRSTIVFGFQVTRDDDHLAALELSQAIRDATQQYTDFDIRIGIATAEYSCSSLDDLHRLAASSSKSLRSAAAIAAIANPGDIALCETTQRSCARRFDFFASNSTLPGSVRLAAADTAEYLPATFTEMVGRESEFELLLSNWKGLSKNKGLVWFVSGDAGIGKSTLCRMLMQSVEQSAAGTVVFCDCQARSTHIPLHPMLTPASRLMGLDTLNSSQEKMQAVEDRLLELGFADPAATEVLSEFLQLDAVRKKRLSNPSPGVRRSLLLEIFSRLLVQSEQGPRLIVIDDFQWADATSVNLIDRLVEQGPIANTMILLLARSETRPDWINRPHVMHINLSPFEETHALQIVHSLDKDNLLRDNDTSRIIGNAEGNPLFIREITRSVLAGKSSGDESEEILSKSIRHILSARVDELGEEKNVLLHASVIGNKFDMNQLETLTGLPATELEDSLKALANTNMIHQTGLYPVPTFEFNHSLLQGAVYLSIPASRLKKLHTRLAELLEGSAIQQDKHSLAFHFEAGGQYEKAAFYWLQSASRAKSNSLLEEAGDHYQRAAASLAKSKPTLRRDELELQTRIEFGPVLMYQQGYANDLVRENYLVAERLCDRLADRGSAYVPQALFGLWSYKVVRGELHEAKLIGDNLLEMALKLNSEELELEANVLLGVTQTHLSEYDEALDRLQRAISLYDPKKHEHHKHLFGQDPGMAANIYCGVAMAQCDRLAEAVGHFERGLIIARRSSHANSLCFALVITSSAALAAGDLDAVAFRAKEAYDIAQSSEFPLWKNAAQFLTHTHDYRVTGEAAHVYAMLETLGECKRVGNSLSYLDFASTVANALIDINDLENAQRVVSDAKAELDRRVKCSDATAVRAVESRLLSLLNK